MDLTWDKPEFVPSKVYRDDEHKPWVVLTNATWLHESWVPWLNSDVKFHKGVRHFWEINRSFAMLSAGNRS